jgi:L-seryl-tRNA(Ser) seleniumtransferase
MEDASKSFVQIPELQSWAGIKIAEATGAEAGLPTAGASNAIMLAAAACIMKGTDLEKYDPLELETWTRIVQRLPMHTEGLKTEFIVQKANRNVYDHSVECVGGRMIEVGSKEVTTELELDQAFKLMKTAAYYFTVRSPSPLSLETIIKIAHKNKVPVIVDAASELPPKNNLKKYISLGVDLVIFSGGKFIAGPNNSGMLAGKKDLIKLAHLQAYPFHGIGRASKMSRETIVGLITALEIYLKLDEKALYGEWLKKAKWMAQELADIEGIETGLVYHTTVEEKEPVAPLCYLTIEEKVYGITGEELSKILREGDPSIEAPYEAGYLGSHSKKLTINPEFMLDGEEVYVVQKIKEVLTPT